MVTVKLQELLLPVWSVAVVFTSVTPGCKATLLTSSLNITGPIELSVTSGFGHVTMVDLPNRAA
jgi:hypothetical protein